MGKECCIREPGDRVVSLRRSSFWGLASCPLLPGALCFSVFAVTDSVCTCQTHASPHMSPLPTSSGADTDGPVWGWVSTWSEGASRSPSCPPWKKDRGRSPRAVISGGAWGPRSGEGSDLREKEGLYGRHILHGRTGCREGNGQRGDNLKPCPLCPPPAPGAVCPPAGPTRCPR